MSGLMYAVNVNYVVSGGVEDEPRSAKSDLFKVDDSKGNTSKPTPTSSPPPKLDPPKLDPPKLDPPELDLPELDPPKPSERKLEPIVEVPKVEPEASKTDIKDEDAKEGLEGSCSIDSRLMDGGIGSDSETNSIDGDGVENFRDIEGEERIRVIKDLTSGDRIAYFTEEELGKAKKKRLHRRRQSDPFKGFFGLIFREQDWYYDPELRYVKDYDIKGYRKRRIQRWLSEVLPIYEDERFDRYLVRCHTEALKELKSMNQEYEDYQNMFPHIVDKWVAILHFGMLYKRKNMGKSCDIDESELIVKLIREQCELLYFKTKIIFFEEADERRDRNIIQKEHWILHPKNLCGNKSPI